MAGEEANVVKLRDDFYRDGFGKILLLIAGICGSIAVLIALSVYVYMDKPPPVTFPVDNEMRVLPPVPLDQPYLTTPDLLQWVSDVVPKAFDLDFNHYNDEMKQLSSNFTADGWKTFLNQLNIVANYNSVLSYKLFTYGSPAAAPYVLREGVLQETGKYGWWVQIPVKINYAGFQPPIPKSLTLQVLVVRVSTLNNLTGVAIDNVIQAEVTKDQPAGNG